MGFPVATIPGLFKKSDGSTSRGAWRSVLAGAYAGNPARRGAEMLDHFVLLERFADGRLVRETGDTLCGRVPPENMSDVGAAEVGAEPKKCSRCFAMVEARRT